MKLAYLTFIRKKDNEIKFLAVDSPENLNQLCTKNVRSGLPIIVVLERNNLDALYIIGTDGDLFQVFGEQDSLFFMKKTK